MISRDLLTHDNNLVPIRIRVATDHRAHSACSVNKCIPVAPDKIDFAELRQIILAVGIDGECAVDQVGGLVIKAVRHVEIGFGNRI